MLCPEKILVPKKLDKQHKTRDVFSQDFQNVIELKQYNDLYSDTLLHNSVIHKNGKDLRNEGFYSTVTSTVLSIVSKKVKKDNRILKRL